MSSYHVVATIPAEVLRDLGDGDAEVLVIHWPDDPGVFEAQDAWKVALRGSEDRCWGPPLTIDRVEVSL